MSAARFIFVEKHTSISVFDSTPKTQLCPCATGRASFLGGNAGTHIHQCLARTVAAFLRPKPEKYRHHAAAPTRGRKLFAEVIYA
jgi:hypothetical protein